jgi:hypothetical protein
MPPCCGNLRIRPLMPDPHPIHGSTQFISLARRLIQRAGDSAAFAPAKASGIHPPSGRHRPAPTVRLGPTDIDAEVPAAIHPAPLRHRHPPTAMRPPQSYGRHNGTCTAIAASAHCDGHHHSEMDIHRYAESKDARQSPTVKRSPSRRHQRACTAVCPQFTEGLASVVTAGTPRHCRHNGNDMQK